MKALTTILGIGLILLLVAFLVYNSIGLVKAIKKWRKQKKEKSVDEKSDAVSTKEK